MKKPVIMILDSGVGGLSVAGQIRKLRPDARLVYVADNGGFPYGDKSPGALSERVSCVLESAVAKYSPDLIVIACNTASTALLAELRRKFLLPFVGVVPAIKPACQISQSKHIGVLATQNTVAGSYIQDLIKNFASGCTLFLYGSPLLATIAEQKLRGVQPDLSILHSDLLQLQAKDHTGKMDTVVLACTHFPLLVNELKSALPAIQNWIDSGEAIARRVDYCLTEAGLINASIAEAATPGQQQQNNAFLTTCSASAPYSPQHIERFLGPHSTTLLKIGGLN